MVRRNPFEERKMDQIPLWLTPVFFAIALAYATVGLGGGSSYLAVLALVGLPPSAMAQVALACNALVTAGGTWHFSRAGHVSPRTLLSYVLGSVPVAYAGGRIEIAPRVFTVVLGFALLCAGVQMLVSLPDRTARAGLRTRPWWTGLLVGAALGLVSGLVGIGGGVFLAAFLVLARWSDARGAAGAAAVFTFLNSIAGLAGQAHKGFVLGASVVPLLLAVVAGGQMGSRLGSRRLSPTHMRRWLAALLVFVSLRVLWGAAR
jgi:hypothetical protein